MLADPGRRDSLPHIVRVDPSELFHGHRVFVAVVGPLFPSRARAKGAEHAEAVGEVVGEVLQVGVVEAPEELQQDRDLRHRRLVRRGIGSLDRRRALGHPCSAWSSTMILTSWSTSRRILAKSWRHRRRMFKTSSQAGSSRGRAWKGCGMTAEARQCDSSSRSTKGSSVSSPGAGPMTGPPNCHSEVTHEIVERGGSPCGLASEVWSAVATSRISNRRRATPQCEAVAGAIVEWRRPRPPSEVRRHVVQLFLDPRGGGSAASRRS